MSNQSSFNASQFKLSFAVLAAKTDDRAQALAAFLGESLSDAAVSFLIDGSDALNQALAVIQNGGKSSFAVKARKVIKTLAFDGFTPYGTISEFAFVKAPTFIGGNATKQFKDAGVDRAAEIIARSDACAEFGDAIKAKTLALFSKAAPDAGAVIDPLAGIAMYSEKTIDAKLAGANAAQLDAALARIASLQSLITAALATVSEAERAASEAEAKAKAEADEAARIKEEENARITAEAAELAELRKLKAAQDAIVAQPDAPAAVIGTIKAKGRKTGTHG